MLKEIRDTCEHLASFAEFEKLCCQQVKQIAKHHLEAANLMYETGIYLCAKQSCEIAYVAYYLLGKEAECKEMKHLSSKLAELL